MRVDFECTGGFANLRLDCHLDTEQLPEDVARRLLKHVADAGILESEQSPRGDPSPGPPDVFHYRLSLREGSKRVDLSCCDTTAPPSVHPLLGFLRKLALDQRKSQGK